MLGFPWMMLCQDVVPRTVRVAQGVAATIERVVSSPSGTLKNLALRALGGVHSALMVLLVVEE